MRDVVEQPIRAGDKTARSKNVVLIKMLSRMKSGPDLMADGAHRVRSCGIEKSGVVAVH